MRSTCWGARSGRSLMTIWPLVVSIRIVFSLSASGTGRAVCRCASAGVMHARATSTARTRIIGAPSVRPPGASLHVGRDLHAHHHVGGCRRLALVELVDHVHAGHDLAD